MTRITEGDGLVIDLRYQTLCLKDALATGNDGVLLRAVETIARARGLTQLAADGGVERDRLVAVLGNARADIASLRILVAGCWELALQTVLP